jgi:ligand-binding sensor domain-containing protein
MQLSRALRRWLLLGGILLLFLCLGGLAYLITSYPLLGSTAVSAPPITWTRLPTPTVLHPNFTSYSHAAPLNDLARRDGLLWAASDGGLLVWDERTGDVAKFTSEHGLAENRTTSVAIGLDGAIWVGTASAGVGRYDGTAWLTFTSADGLPGDSVRDLAVGADGTIWAATANGIGRYDGRRWFSYNRSRTLLQLPSNNVTSLALAPDGVTIFAGTTEGVVQFNGRSWNSLAQVGSEAINTVQDVAVTPDGRLWAATQAGLTLYDGSGWQIFTSADGLASEDVRRVAANADGSVWLSYGEQGLGLTRFELSSAIPTASGRRPTPRANQRHPARCQRPLAGQQRWPAAARRRWRLAKLHPTPTTFPANDLVDLLVADGQPWLATATGVSRLSGRQAGKW